MFWSAPNAITKYSRPDSLNHRLRSHKCLPGGWKSKTKALADSDLGDNPLSGLQMGTFSLCPHKVERERALASSSSIATQFHDRGPTLHNYLLKVTNANYLLKLHLQIQPHGTSTHEFGGAGTQAFTL